MGRRIKVALNSNSDNALSEMNFAFSKQQLKLVRFGPDGAAAAGGNVERGECAENDDHEQKHDVETESGRTRVAIVIFKEPPTEEDANDDMSQTADDAGGSSRSWWGQAIARTANWAAKTFQPSPRLLHCELAIVNENGNVYHFATYIGQRAAWQARDRDYYERGGWRALVIPTHSCEEVDAIGQACSACAKAPNSLSRYVASTNLGSKLLSPFLSDNDRSPAHCAGLTARILRRALGDRIIDQDPIRYNPTLLYTTILNTIQASNKRDLDGVSIERSETTEQAPQNSAGDALRLLRTACDEEILQLGQKHIASAYRCFANETLRLCSNNASLLADSEIVGRLRELHRLCMRVSVACEATTSDIDITMRTAAARSTWN